MTFYNDITEANARIQLLEKVADAAKIFQDIATKDCPRSPSEAYFLAKMILRKRLAALDAKEEQDA